MGLSTASVRHVVMAPALTETTQQSQTFKLAPATHFQSASPIKSFETNDHYDLGTTREYYKSNGDVLFTAKNDYLNGQGELIESNDIVEDKHFISCLKASNKISKGLINNIMNSPLPMGDQNVKMGLNKMELDPVTSVASDRKLSDMEQLLKNFNSDSSPGAEPVELPPNVDDIMRVITSIESGNDRLGSVCNDLNTSLNEEDFHISGADLATNILSFEKQLLNDVDMMNISIEEPQDSVESIKESRSKDLVLESKTMQSKIQRRLDFLKRRVLKFQSRLTGQHISGEMAGTFEHVHRSLKKLKENSIQESTKSLETPIEKLKPLSSGSVKALVKKLEATVGVQANAVARLRNVPKYFGSGSVDTGSVKSSLSGVVNLPPWTGEHKLELQKVSGALQSELRIIQAEIDSEATESSSGGESCDEFQSYNNQHQQYLCIQKRALWKYATERAAIAARWTWLQVQISDLEYRIRQHAELHRQVRGTKGPIELDGTDPSLGNASPQTALNGFRGQIAAAESTNKTDGEGSDVEFQCARTRPIRGYKKRKLLQINGLHIISKKAARPSTVHCGCVPPKMTCAVCTGRSDPTVPRESMDVLSKSEKVAHLDPSFHPVFSMVDDVSGTIHLEAIMKMPEWQQRSARIRATKGQYGKLERLDKTGLDHRTKKLEHRKKYEIKNKIRGRKSSKHLRISSKRFSSSHPSNQIQSSNDGMDEEVESLGFNASSIPKSAGASPCSSPLLQMQSISGFSRKSRVDSYDIDNIVIPYSVAASTRVEKLQYKEILTPKWRIADQDFPTACDTKNNGLLVSAGELSDTEDLSEETLIQRHDKCEHDERKKFLSYLKLPLGYSRVRSHKRTDSRAESSGANTPDPMSPHTVDVNPENSNPGCSPMGSPPATPISANADEGPLPSISVLRRRTISQSRYAKDKEPITKESGDQSNIADQVEVIPYDTRTFPLDEETYEKMLKNMPEDHQFTTNARAQDLLDMDASVGYLDSKIDSPSSESTESILAEEDPNDPEWIEVEKAARERHKK